ncbi:MAG: ATP-binding cassette domain-containing protein [Bacteroidales bacterium]|nr:MAG: ATP-binding cassette domain-containing protein [Bacteroidales bacterium]
MSESVLNALIHLFAIVATVKTHGVSQKGRRIVELYLRRYLNEELTNEYLKVFDNYLDFYKRELAESIGDSRNEDASIISFQITNVCRQIQKELLRNERIIVFLQLLEFVNEDNVVTKEELDFINIVASTFNISESEYNNIKAFILESTTENIEKSNTLIIDNQVKEWSENIAWFMKKEQAPKREIEKHIYKENLYGKIVILYIQSINSFVLRYFGELNLYLEGHKIVPLRAYFLNTGAIIKGPNIESIYYSDIVYQFIREEEKKRIIFSGMDISFRFKRSENGIRRFNFTEESGNLIGIMGGSGVGKTTLLNILSGKLKPDTGKIMINGYDVYKFRNRLKSYIGFVPQDDLLFEELTVFQNMYYNAKLCLSEFSKQDINRTIIKILSDLELLDIKDLPVGNPLNKFISGGQRKRLNIALELIREPSVLFIDEPTSGLSSSDSEKVIQILRKQIAKGRLVIANIHQPSSGIFKMFDKLWILDKGGFPIYTGNPIDAVVYFKKISARVNAAESECPACGNVNPEQILQIVETKEIDQFGNTLETRRIPPEEWFQHYQENIDSQIIVNEAESKLPPSSFKIPNAYRQFQTYFMRNLLGKLTNRQYLIVSFLEAPLLAFILGYFSKFVGEAGYVFEDNKNLPVFLFMSVVVALFMGITVSAEEIIQDRKILERESFLNLSRISYLNSKIFYLFLVSAIQTCSFIIVGSAVLEIRGMILSFWLILFSTSCFGNMLGLNISSGLNSVITIYVLVPLLLVPQLLLGGAMIHFDDIHRSLTSKEYVPVVGDMMTTRWAYEAMVVEQFMNNEFEKHFFEYEQQISSASYITSFLIPQMEAKIEECIRMFNDEDQYEQLQRNLAILKNELIRFERFYNFFPFDRIDDLTVQLFHPDLVEEMHIFLDLAKSNFSDIAQEANIRKDEVYNHLVDSLGSDEIFNLKQKYYNNKLADIVTNRTGIIKIAELEDRFVRKKDPIFMMPESNLGRAHFYAPFKVINERPIETIWFNLFFIWLTTIILYFALLFDLLRKVISYFENLRLRKAG